MADIVRQIRVALIVASPRHHLSRTRQPDHVIVATGDCLKCFGWNVLQDEVVGADEVTLPCMVNTGGERTPS